MTVLHKFGVPSLTVYATSCPHRLREHWTWQLLAANLAKLLVQNLILSFIVMRLRHLGLNVHNDLILGILNQVDLPHEGMEPL